MRKFIVCLCSVLIVMSLMTLICCAAVYTVSMIRYEMLRSNWCWAACAEMLAKSQVDTTLDQTDAVKFIYGYVTNTGASYTDSYLAVRYLSDYEVVYIKGSVPLQLQATIKKIRSGYPIIASCDVVDSDTGHQVIIYKTNDTGNLSIYDPVPSEDCGYPANTDYDYPANYDDFVNSTIETPWGGEMTWVHYVSVSGFAEGIE